MKLFAVVEHVYHTKKYEVGSDRFRPFLCTIYVLLLLHGAGLGRIEMYCFPVARYHVSIGTVSA